jgi:hypothetical protein
MEFSSNASLEKYLHFVPKGAEKLPTLKELLSQEKKTFNASFFLKIFLLIGIISGISFYAYKYFQKNNIENQLEKSVTMEHPVLKDRTNEPIVNIPMVEEEKIKVEPLEDIILEKYEENIPRISDIMEEIDKEDEANLLEELSIIKKDEENMTLKSEVIAEEKNLSEMLNSQDTMNLELSVDDDINTKIKGFLEVYIDASATSVESSLKFYDKHLKRYFKFRNASHKTISDSQKRYNKKWVNREFKILDFEIIKSYKRENISYVDVKTITEWNVSNIRGKKATGKSRGFMTLKEVENSFKITSIYTLK